MRSSPRQDLPADDGERACRRCGRRFAERGLHERAGWFHAARPQSGRADLHRESLERRGVHAARVRQPDAGYAGRGLGSQPQRGEYLGRQDGEVPRPVHQVGRVPARNHQPSDQGAGGRKIPNLEERVAHILTKQVFGIGITQPHQPAGAAQRVLLEARQRGALDCQVLRQ
jgi:hypothetical protein